MKREFTAAAVLAAALILPAAAAPAALAAAPSSPQAHRSAEGCNLFYPWNVNGHSVCINVNGSGDFVASVQLAAEVRPGRQVTGYFVVRTTLPAASGTWAFRTPVHTFRQGSVGLSPVWWMDSHHSKVSFVVSRVTGLDYTAGRTPHQQVCAFFYFPSGKQQGGPACINVYK